MPFFQRQLDSESGKVSSKKAIEKIEMLQNKRQEVKRNMHSLVNNNYYIYFFVSVCWFFFREYKIINIIVICHELYNIL